jgi:hypothetical protein
MSRGKKKSYALEPRSDLPTYQYKEREIPRNHSKKEEKDCYNKFED